MYISGIQPRLVMTDAGLDASLSVAAVNQHGEPQQGYIAAERPLTIYLNKRELVTLMTLGTQPELLVLGWLRNQRMVSDIARIRSVQVDWSTTAPSTSTSTLSHRLARWLGKSASKKKSSF